MENVSDFEKLQTLCQEMEQSRIENVANILSGDEQIKLENITFASSYNICIKLENVMNTLSRDEQSKIENVADCSLGDT
jgi:hypothetical protein